jgi:selenocysteine lyase/cysteine desulfurase
VEAGRIVTEPVFCSLPPVVSRYWLSKAPAVTAIANPVVLTQALRGQVASTANGAHTAENRAWRQIRAARGIAAHFRPCYKAPLVVGSSAESSVG